MSIFDKVKIVNTITGEIKEPVDISPFEWSDEKQKKIDNMMQEYHNAFLSMGFNTENRNLIEVLTFLVNELNKTQAAYYNLKKKVEENYEAILRGGY